jgi:secondary thiamine-phosphate synthase enzyme
MKQSLIELSFETQGSGLTDVTQDLNKWVREQNIIQGLLTIFIRHTSASLTIQENADPDVLYDLHKFFEKLVPQGERLYRHDAEGPDDMPAHIKSALTQSQISIPVMDGNLALGTWQGIYIFEHRTHPHQRRLLLHLTGE